MKPVFDRIETKKALLYSCLVLLFIIICSWSSVQLNVKELDESITFSISAEVENTIDEEASLLHIPHLHIKHVNTFFSTGQWIVPAYLTSVETLKHFENISLHTRFYLLNSINAP